MSKPKKPEPISGIYLIKCIPLNKHYIGSSNNVQRRLQTHKRELEAGSHNNRLLQHDYDKYGAKAFTFLIIFKEVPEEKLTAYEKVFIYKYDSIVRYKGYNDIWPTTNHSLFKEAYQDLKEKGLL